MSRIKKQCRYTLNPSSDSKIYLSFKYYYFTFDFCIILIFRPTPSVSFNFSEYLVLKLMQKNGTITYRGQRIVCFKVLLKGCALWTSQRVLICSSDVIILKRFRDYVERDFVNILNIRWNFQFGLFLKRGNIPVNTPHLN